MAAVGAVEEASAYWFVVPAAGIGSRFGADKPKQYALIDEYCVIEHSITRLLQWRPSSQVVVAVAERDRWWSQLSISQDPRVNTVIGGGERAQSVFNALEFIQDRAGSNVWVLVHDAARPCVDSASLTRLEHRVQEEGSGGLLAIPVADTLKKASLQNTVRQTVDRSALWAAQTPQMFRFQPLFSALQQALMTGRIVTDEASALEYQGVEPVLVEGDCRNIKITRPEDIDLARFYIASERL
ncbi:2-C-methyl-D-erythritol 4-phosphate cytidylyltransferase [Sinobacterium caligoides]|uniref:2-C-methyl-D-erythritol 4-phosphate cytidylyltransferase n=1 Tax=Sinobacterium caligoides TaxID=933926 RepID=A0A3N2DMI6_9GAMM|nr:2-C-methyl-D-erythritol 4-phosphate cytidylyltransferase [Sinobacterium caligoides]ROS01026.1 2-C-methyl-D-erythritol 4-phosphate cytidylyltransferase [Sinobacterium caligoides]